MELIRRFPDLVVASALESWDFLDLADKSPLFTSPFGDVFMQGPKSYWLLDVVGGSLSELCSTGEELTAILNTKDGRDEYLMVGLAAEAEANGLVPSGDEIYGERTSAQWRRDLRFPSSARTRRLAVSRESSAHRLRGCRQSRGADPRAGAKPPAGGTGSAGLTLRVEWFPESSDSGQTRFRTGARAQALVRTIKLGASSIRWIDLVGWAIVSMSISRASRPDSSKG
ncbi:hypothetical protein RS86_01988 [Microbacterium azadirachtae]|uniref:Uncharacterized protein n=1 Tax=Microbacterium azadirachtae TaxID=582680 RepID=A0A0F0LJL7_9MICO|nr:hypothetical protein RS86_01988 [Microbacterium azadirachtae]